MAVDLPFPPRYIVDYINDKLLEYEIISSGQVVPIIATAPSNTDEIWDQLIAGNQTTPILIQYDRLMRFRPNSFYPTKREQMALYIYGNLSLVNDSVLVIQNLLDREDAAAEDVNKWARKKTSGGNITFANGSFTHNVYFHNIKVYQVDESRDVTELASARAIYVNKIIIEYDYHVKYSSVKDGTNTAINY